MAYEYQPWPAWAHGPKGESAICEREEDVPEGWTHHGASPVASEGREELDGLRAHYKAVVGKKPFAGWSADQIRAKLDEFEGR